MPAVGTATYGVEASEGGLTRTEGALVIGSGVVDVAGGVAPTGGVVRGAGRGARFVAQGPAPPPRPPIRPDVLSEIQRRALRYTDDGFAPRDAQDIATREVIGELPREEQLELLADIGRAYGGGRPATAPRTTNFDVDFDTISTQPVRPPPSRVADDLLRGENLRVEPPARTAGRQFGFNPRTPPERPAPGTGSGPLGANPRPTPAEAAARRVRRESISRRPETSFEQQVEPQTLRFDPRYDQPQRTPSIGRSPGYRTFEQPPASRPVSGYARTRVRGIEEAYPGQFQRGRIEREVIPEPDVVTDVVTQPRASARVGVDVSPATDINVDIQTQPSQRTQTQTFLGEDPAANVSAQPSQRTQTRPGEIFDEETASFPDTRTQPRTQDQTFLGEDPDALPQVSPQLREETGIETTPRIRTGEATGVEPDRAPADEPETGITTGTEPPPRTGGDEEPPPRRGGGEEPPPPRDTPPGRTTPRPRLPNAPNVQFARDRSRRFGDGDYTRKLQHREVNDVETDVDTKEVTTTNVAASRPRVIETDDDPPPNDNIVASHRTFRTQGGRVRRSRRVGTRRSRAPSLVPASYQRDASRMNRGQLI